MFYKPVWYSSETIIAIHAIFRDDIGEGVHSLVNSQTAGLKLKTKWFYSLVYFKDLLIFLIIILWPEDWKNLTDQRFTCVTIN